MEIFDIAVLGLLILIAGQTVLTVWSRRDTVGRVLSVVLFAVSVIFIPPAAMELLGWHKPLWAAWRVPKDTRILAQKLIEGEAIYLYLDVGAGEPRAVKLPWDENTVERLQKALRESLRRGRRGAMLERDDSLDQNERKFHPLPQPRLPMPKGPPPVEPRRYRRGA